MTETNTTTLGRTKIVYGENGQIVSQSLPAGIWQQGPPPPAIPTRLRKPGPTPLADILAQVENIEQELAEATIEYEKSLLPGGADPHAREKHTLASKIAALRAELDPLEFRLKELQSLPAPAVAFKLSVARAEQLTNGAAMQLTNTLAEKKSDELHQQPLASQSQRSAKTDPEPARCKCG
jgi:hypothetical protein